MDLTPREVWLLIRALEAMAGGKKVLKEGWLNDGDAFYAGELLKRLRAEHQQQCAEDERIHNRHPNVEIDAEINLYLQEQGIDPKEWR